MGTFRLWREWKRRTDPDHYLNPKERAEAGRRAVPLGGGVLEPEHGRGGEPSDARLHAARDRSRARGIKMKVDGTYVLKFSSDLVWKLLNDPDVLKRLKENDEEFLVELERRYASRLMFRGDPAYHHEKFTITDANTGAELKP